MNALLRIAATIALVATSSIAPAAWAEAPEAVVSFAWSTDTDLGDTAARVTLTLLEPSLCSWHFHMAGDQAERGGTFMFMSLANATEGRFSGLSAASYRSYHAHVGEFVDARAPVRVEGVATVFPTGRFAAQGWTNGSLPLSPDTYTFTAGGLGLAPTAESGLGAVSLRLEISCDAGFRVDGFSGSHELMLWNANNMRGGVGVFASLAADVAVGDHVERVFASPLVQNELWFKRYNEAGHAGALTRATPEATTTWDLLAEVEVQVYDATGPGLHRYDLTRVGLDFFSTLGGASYGLAPVGSLDELVPA